MDDKSREIIINKMKRDIAVGTITKATSMLAIIIITSVFIMLEKDLFTTIPYEIATLGFIYLYTKLRIDNIIKAANLHGIDIIEEMAKSLDEE